MCTKIQCQRRETGREQTSTHNSHVFEGRGKERSTNSGIDSSEGHTGTRAHELEGCTRIQPCKKDCRKAISFSAKDTDGRLIHLSPMLWMLNASKISLVCLSWYLPITLVFSKDGVQEQALQCRGR